MHPQPDLADLEKLVAEMDVPTTLHIEGEEQPLSAGIALSSFRIVQEALTNVRRHARAESVAVTLRYLPTAWRSRWRTTVWVRRRRPGATA